jgi:hypothetical protein
VWDHSCLLGSSSPAIAPPIMRELLGNQSAVPWNEAGKIRSSLCGSWTVAQAPFPGTRFDRSPCDLHITSRKQPGKENSTSTICLTLRESVRFMETVLSTGCTLCTAWAYCTLRTGLGRKAKARPDRPVWRALMPGNSIDLVLIGMDRSHWPP